MDIDKIAKAAGCNYDDCLLKIDYLKNKRVIGNLYIDTKNGIINDCSEEDEELLKSIKDSYMELIVKLKKLQQKCLGPK